MKYESLSKLVDTTCVQLHKRLETVKQFQDGRMYHLDYKSFDWRTKKRSPEHTTGIFRGVSINSCGMTMSVKMDVLTSTEKPCERFVDEKVPVNSTKSFRIPEGMVMGAPPVSTGRLCRDVTAFREIHQDDLLIYVGDAYTSERFKKYLSGTNRARKIVPDITPEPSSKLVDVLKCLQQVTA